MAKKKGRRSANVARKREKRKRYQKSRQKQIAVEKQRRLRHEKSEEEHLHACISQSRELLLEPEFEGIFFDPELMYAWVMDFLSDYDVDDFDTPPDESIESIDENLISVANEPDEESSIVEQFGSMSEAEQACENFQLEVLPNLVTPEFQRRLCQALTACETRLERTGNRRLAEVAYVTRTLFEAAPPEIIVLHPMIQAIGIETLRVLVEEQDTIVEWRDGVRDMLSDVLEHESVDAHPTQQVSVFSDTPVDDEPHKNEEAELAPPHVDATGLTTRIGPERTFPDPEEPREAPITETALNPELKPVTSPETSLIETVSQPIRLSVDELPAQALYKNFKGLAIRETFEGRTDETSSQNGPLSYALVNESEDQVEFVDIENERYVKVTEDRLQLHARSEAELSIAMAEVEALCTSTLMYLAKTIEERG